jgi:hypothetical protein
MNVSYPIADIGMAAFSVFFMQSPSFLAHQRYLQEGQGRSNCETLFGISKIPGDGHIRYMLDPVDPVLVDLKQSGGLSAFRRPSQHALLAFDGSEYFCSNDINCPHCSTVGAARIRPGISTPYWQHPLWHPDTTTSCRRSPNSSNPRMAPTSTTARPGQRSAGWPRTAPSTTTSTRSILVMTCIPASRCVIPIRLKNHPLAGSDRRDT